MLIPKFVLIPKLAQGDLFSLLFSLTRPHLQPSPKDLAPKLLNLG